MKTILFAAIFMSLSASALVRNKTLAERAIEEAVLFGRRALQQEDFKEPEYRIGKSEAKMLANNNGLFVTVYTQIQDRKTGSRATVTSTYRVDFEGQKITGVRSARADELN